jgi:outer membrane protein assembly factor BamB
MLLVICGAAFSAENWPQWRGPTGTGSAPEANPPLLWSETNNLRWKVEVPGAGNSSPVVWGGKVFILTAVDTDRKVEQKPNPDEAKLADWQKKMRTRPTAFMQFVVLAVDIANGRVLWRQTAAEGVPHEPRHQDGSWASASPVTDGEFVFANFGSKGLYAYDIAGTFKWKRDFGQMTVRNSFGEGSSPTVHGNLVVVVWDHQGKSFITALDRGTGEEKWKVDRDEMTSWATPVVVPVKDRFQVLTSATGKIRGYDLLTGGLVWECGGMTTNPIPTPSVANGIAYFASGFRGAALVAVKLGDASGDITAKPAIAWTYGKDTPYVPSPLLHGANLYITKVNDEVLSCLDAAAGALRYGPQRLEGLKGIYSSPVAAANRVYVTGRNGVTAVVQAGEIFKVLALNTLNDGFTASAAVTDKALILRGHRFLYCIAEAIPQVGAP